VPRAGALTDCRTFDEDWEGGETEILRDPGHLAALHDTALVGSRTDEAFDRLTRIAAIMLAGPVALMVLVGRAHLMEGATTGSPTPRSGTWGR
jgi:hypothetical protein